MSKEQDAAVVRNFSLVLFFLVVIGVAAYMIAKMVSGDIDKTQDTDVAIAARLAPIGGVNTGEPFIMGGAEAGPGQAAAASSEATVAAAVPATGKAAYGKICFACHDAGIGGAPKHGDTAAWAGRIDKGPDMMVSNAINGMTGEAGMMPPKGGLPSLSDDDVRAAVMYMLAAIGAGGAAGAAASEVTEAPATEPAIEVADAPEMGAGRGKEVYDSACFVCHATGVAGAPKLGDVAGWAPRITQSVDTLYARAIKGFMGEAGLMPPKGGRMDYSDDDVKAAVDYMVGASR